MGFFLFEIIMNVYEALSDLFEYPCYGSMAIRNIFTRTVCGSTLVVQICRLKSIPHCKSLYC